MKKRSILIIFCIINLSSFAQQAQIGESGRTLLVWPFDQSYYINQQLGSHGWNMICGPGCGLHKNSDQYALDWSRVGLSACGSIFNAPLSGKVLHVTYGSNTGYGNQLVIQSDQDTSYAFRMGHMQEIWVQNGDLVEEGEPLGRVGDTGNGSCHGHLAVYRQIYDRAEIPLVEPIDSSIVYLRAIDYLRRGDFVPTPYSNKAYFSEPFGFIHRTEGIAVEQFTVKDFEMAVEDSIETKVRIRNVGQKPWQGTLAIEISESETYPLYSMANYVGRSDTFTLEGGTFLEFNFSFPLSDYSPGLYFAHLLFVSEVFSSDLGVPVELRTPLRDAGIRLLSKEECNLDEPNDQISMATDLFPAVLSSRKNLEIREDFISIFEDEKDIFRLQSARQGVMTLIFSDTLRFKMKIFNQSDQIPVSRQGEKVSFITAPNRPYFIEFTGPASCNRPYNFSYEWYPADDVVWNFTASNNHATSELTVLEAGSMEWQIIDLMGRRLFSSGKKRLTPGKYSFSTPMDNFSSGIYLAALFVDGQIIANKKFFWTK